MRLKEIKPGMVIHCKTLEEMEQAIEHYKIDEDASLIWNYKSSLDDERRDCLQFNESGNYTGFCSREYFECEGYTITEFSDLILPDMTEKEAIEWMAKHLFDEEFKKVFGFDYLREGALSAMTSEEMIERIDEWKADHSKKEPEIETVDICRIIEIQPDGRKRCVHEEDMNNPNRTLGDKNYLCDVEEILKRYCMEHDGKFIAVHEVVSRVKR